MLAARRRFEPNLADDGWLDVERRMNAVIRQEAQQRHSTLVEVSDVLSGPENFTHWVHFTNRGANIMANLIADQLLAHELDNIGLAPNEARRQNFTGTAHKWKSDWLASEA